MNAEHASFSFSNGKRLINNKLCSSHGHWMLSCLNYRQQIRKRNLDHYELRLKTNHLRPSLVSRRGITAGAAPPGPTTLDRPIKTQNAADISFQLRTVYAGTPTRRDPATQRGRLPDIAQQVPTPQDENPPNWPLPARSSPGAVACRSSEPPRYPPAIE